MTCCDRTPSWNVAYSVVAMAAGPLAITSKRIESSFIKKANDWLDLIKQKDRDAITHRMENLKLKLMKASGDYERSYKIMYKMLEATEN